MHLSHSVEPLSNAKINTDVLGGQMYPHTHGPCSHINTHCSLISACVTVNFTVGIVIELGISQCFLYL